VPRDVADDVVWFLRLDERQIDGVRLLAAHGRLSNRTAPMLKSALDALGTAQGGGLVLDLAGIDYISSAGLRAVEHASQHLRAAGGMLVVCGLQAPVRVAFALAGLESQVVIEPSGEVAAARVRDGRGAKG